LTPLLHVSQTKVSGEEEIVGLQIPTAMKKVENAHNFVPDAFYLY